MFNATPATDTHLSCIKKFFPEDLEKRTQLKSLILFKTETKVLPEGIAKLTNLEKLELNFNALENVDVLAKTTSLVYLSVSKNKITRLPEDLSWENLQTLLLDGNLLSKVPEKLYECTSLTCLSLKNNNFSDKETVKQEVEKRLPNLKKLFV